MGNTEKKGMLGIYARQSKFDERKGKESSVHDQTLHGIAKAEELKLEYKLYQDINESAMSDSLDNRPECTRMLKDVQAGIITAVFVYNQDRLCRNLKANFVIKEVLSEHKILIHTILDGIIDYTDSNSEFMADFRTLMGNKTVKDTTAKIKSKLLSNAINGRAGGGAVLPYGYKRAENKMLVIDEEEAKIYHQIVSLYLSGKGYKAIAKWLNSNGIHTKARKNYKNGINSKNKHTGVYTHIEQSQIIWAGTTVGGILKNTIYKGEKKYLGKFYPAPAIITSEKWDEIQNARTSNVKFSKRNNKRHFYLLYGLLRCEFCGRNLYGIIKDTAGKVQRSYMCSSKRELSCKLPNINLDLLNNLIWNSVSNTDFFIQRIVSELNSTDIKSQVANIKHFIEQDEKQLASLLAKRKIQIELREDQQITKEEFAEKTKGFNSSKIELEHKIQSNGQKIRLMASNVKQEERLIAFVQNVANNISTYSSEEKQQILKEVIKNIAIGYSELNKTHHITVEYNMNVAVTTSLTLDDKGKNNLRLPRYNSATFHDKFNINRHMMIEKHQPEVELLGQSEGRGFSGRRRCSAARRNFFVT